MSLLTLLQWVRKWSQSLQIRETGLQRLLLSRQLESKEAKNVILCGLCRFYGTRPSLQTATPIKNQNRD